VFFQRCVHFNWQSSLVFSWKLTFRGLCFQPVGADSETNVAESSPAAPPSKHVFVRVKRKPFQPPLDAFCNPLPSSVHHSPFVSHSHSTVAVVFTWHCQRRVGNQWEAIEASSLGFWKSINCQFFSRQYAGFLFLSIGFVLFFISCLRNDIIPPFLFSRTS